MRFIEYLHFCKIIRYLLYMRINLCKNDHINFYYYKILLFTAEMYGASLRYMTPFPFPSLRFHPSGFTYLLLPFCQFLFKCESWYSGFLVSCEDCDVAMHRKSSEIR